MLDIFLVLIFTSLSFFYITWILLYLIPKKGKNVAYYTNLSVILPAHNEEASITESIKSILSSDYPKEKEIIVVDDGSTDNTYELVKKLQEKHPEIRLFRIKHSGKANALNFGVGKARFDTLVFLDSDSFLTENSLKNIVHPLSDKEVGAVSGVVRARCTRNPLTWFQDFEYMLSSSWRYVCNVINSTSVVPGFVAVKKKALLKIQGFSEDTLTEDFDIVLRLKKAGYSTVMASSAVIHTTVPGTFKSLFIQRLRWGRGTIQVVKKHSDMFLSRKFGFLGTYTLPTHLYWYIFSLVYLPSVVYWMLSDYYRYFFLNNNIISLSVLQFFLKWFTTYGMFDLMYKTWTGVYLLNTRLFLTILSFVLMLAYVLVMSLKLTKPDLKHVFVYFFFFPYIVFIIFIQCVAFLYEFRRGAKGKNIWEK